MLELSMVRLVKYQEIDLVHGNEGMSETLVQYFCGTDNDPVLFEMLEPDVFGPEISSHGAAESCDFMIEVAFKDSKLLKNQVHRRDLQDWWLDWFVVSSIGHLQERRLCVA